MKNLTILFLSFLLLFACSGSNDLNVETKNDDEATSDNDEIAIGDNENNTGEKSLFKLLITDAPADVIFEAVTIEFDSIEVSQGNKWTVLNKDLGEIDLLKLNNGKLKELVAYELEPGTYNQIRIQVSKASVTIESQTEEIKVASNTIKFVRPFTIEQGKTTELIVDFNANKSINKTGKGFLMTPVIRLIAKDGSGHITNNEESDVKKDNEVDEVEPDGNEIEIDQKENEEPNNDSMGQILSRAYIETTAKGKNEIGTVADNLGRFTVAYMEPGTYEMTISPLNYKPVTITNIKVKAGELLKFEKVLKRVAFIKK